MAVEFARGIPSWFVTVCDVKDRQPIGNLKFFDPNTILRRWQLFLSLIRRCYPKALSFVTIEISASKDINGHIVFEPHLHGIIIGPSKVEVQNLLKEQLTQSQPKRSKPVKVVPISDLGRVFSYSLKVRPELRSTYLSSGGDKRRRDNLMIGIPLREWLLWMSTHNTSQLQHYGGFSRTVIAAMAAGDLWADFANLPSRAVETGQIALRAPFTRGVS